jgi:hypothetical protein
MDVFLGIERRVLESTAQRAYKHIYMGPHVKQTA